MTKSGGGCTTNPCKPLFVSHGRGAGGKHVLCLAIPHAAKRIGDESRTLQVYRLCSGRTAFANYHWSGNDLPPAGFLAVLSEALATFFWGGRRCSVNLVMCQHSVNEYWLHHRLQMQQATKTNKDIAGR